MFLSQLILNPRNRNVRRDLAAPYECHRTLMRAFPSKEDGGPGRVLYRVEIDDERQPPTVLIQSDKRPDWSFLEGTDQAIARPVKEVTFTAAENECESENTVPITAGRRFRFRLVANPTVKREGKRHGLFREPEQSAWLIRKANNSGFKIVESPSGVQENVCITPLGRSCSSKRTTTDTLTILHQGVRFDGILEVVNPQLFIDSIGAGIGSAKGFGFGLLSLARS